MIPSKEGKRDIVDTAQYENSVVAFPFYFCRDAHEADELSIICFG